MIEFKSVNKIFDQKKSKLVALRDINLTIHDGEIVGILGYSGAGKSTLVRLINGLIQPTSGEIIVNKESLSTDKRKAIDRMRHTIGMIFQHFNLIHSMTVYDNIKLALDIAKYPSDKHTRIIELLDLVGLSDKKDSYPKTLSGGQRQRVGIGRALANHPSILLCDEATSALDSKTALEIWDLLKDIHSKTNITIVFITHQIEVIKALCDRVIVMDQGSIVEDTDVKSLFVSPQSSVSKSLLYAEKYEQNLPNLYELIYSHKNADETILSNCIKTYGIDVNIKYAKTLKLKTDSIGFLYVQIEGLNQAQAIEYLKQHQVEVNPYVF
ncbi:methionine ABC transporter ATP-binding protein [Acholeplasma vituli]|uniref:Methionine ABC transporter ATP-binding protein n=1 Tax=Paracholeplasma vituli TaxID=69473 RepID=A0ABT2PYV9_9MOLU|nr:methionine ABC transporter ATP-binding protein [Paracholeplasma vituli]MCU0104917.1 methionine ABC transporter ATP-binding protein [Paracholeplasma vituli]